MQTNTPIVLVVHLYSPASLGTMPGFAEQIAFVAFFPYSVLFALPHPSPCPSFTVHSRCRQPQNLHFLPLPSMKECRLCMLVRESGQRQVLHDYHHLTSFTQTKPYVQNLLCYPLSPEPSHITQFNANQARDKGWSSSLTLQLSPSQVIVSLDSYRLNTGRTSETHLTTSSSPPTYFDTVNGINSRWWEEAAYEKLRTTHDVNEIAIILC
jgi:hypothetical protein